MSESERRFSMSQPAKSEPLLRVARSLQAFSRQGRPAVARGRARSCGGRRVLHRRSRRDAGTGRRIRLRQIHHRPLHPAADRADARARSRFDGQDVLGLGGDGLRALRRKMQIVFQDPFASLNPRMTVGAILGEALTIHKLGGSAREREDRVANLLVKVGLQGRAHAPLSARIFRRPAPAHRASRARWRLSPSSSSATSRSRRSMSRSRRRSSICWKTCRAN